MRVNKSSLLELTGTDRQEGVVICVGRRFLYGLKGGCYMRTNLSIGRPAPSKIAYIFLSDRARKIGKNLWGTHFTTQYFSGFFQTKTHGRFCDLSCV